MKREEDVFNELVIFHSLKSEIQEELKKLWNSFSFLRGGECREHSLEVARISVLIGESFAMNREELFFLFISALFHDIGKVSIDKKVLSKPFKLNEDEYRHIQKHVQVTFFILSRIFGSVFPNVARNAFFHHEAVNGKGYPLGLRGSEIPFESRIISVADVYDAISKQRSYNTFGSSDMAFWVIRNGQGAKFDFSVCNHFLSLKGKKII